jgi:hypothetical protein
MFRLTFQNIHVMPFVRNGQLLKGQLDLVAVPGRSVSEYLHVASPIFSMSDV